jgi:DNA-binding response OmpR family regulator
MQSGNDSEMSDKIQTSNKVLYVDDNVVMLDLVKLLLEQAGYAGLVASNVDDALRMSEGTPLRAMVIDVNLAGDSGLMLMNFMMHNHAGVPVILYSGGEHDQTDVGKMLALGACKFVQKQNGSELVAVLKQLCPLG